jgi:esterase/lipase superfamily enzyme
MLKNRQKCNGVIPILGVIMILLAGCGGPTKLSVTPNVLRDGSGSQSLAAVAPENRQADMQILYATDRAPAGDSEAGPRYGVQRSPSMAFGEATVSLDPSPTWEELVRAAGSKPDGKRYSLNVSKVHEVSKVLVTPASLEVHQGQLRFRPDVEEQFARQREQILDMVRSHLAQTARKDVFIFIHGVDNTFESAVCRAAIMWHYIGRQGVFLAYAWPAGLGGAMGYFYDRESGEYTVLHLKRVLKALAECPEVERIHVIAHSRGGDVSTTALRELNLEYRARGLDPQKELKLETLVLAAADLDVGVFGLRMLIENMAVVARHFVVYSSTKDMAVALSDWLFHSRSRLGVVSMNDIDPAIRELFAQLPGVELVQCSVSGYGTSHDYLFTNPGALSDLILVLRDRRDPGAANGRPLIPRGGSFWQLHNDYALPAKPSDRR